METYGLKDKIIVITGSQGELGKVLTETFIKAEADVWMGCHSSEFEHDREISLDVCDSESVHSTFSKVYQESGRIDILINNAGVMHSGLLLSDKDEKWDEVLDVNLKGMMRCCREVLKFMVPAKSGKIINVSSLAGLRPNVGQSLYAASKAGVEAMTRALAKEVASKQIFVNAVAPGFLDSKMVKVLDDPSVDGLIAKIPLKRLGTTKEAAALIQWLSSEQANYITGQTLRIDGGMGM